MLLSQFMPLSSGHLTASLVLSLLLAAAPAYAQGDALEQPYDSNENSGAAPPVPLPISGPAPVAPLPPPPSLPPPPAPPTRTDVAPQGANQPPAVSGIVAPVVPADDRPLGPIRSRRRLALTGEVGWNGLAGFGAVLGYHIAPHFTTELGGGLSLTGWKAGLRARYNLLTGSVTPFVGVGFMGTSGFGNIKGDFDDQDASTEEVTIRVRPSAFLQAVGGIDWTSRGGFTLVACVGWAHVLNHNLEIVAGNPTPDERRGFDIAFRSGPVITVATGYSFE